MNTYLRLAITTSIIASLLRAQTYELVEVAASPGAYSSIDQCALNDQGHVAFAAALTGATNAGVYLWRGAAATLIAPASTQRTFLGVALANGRDPITAASDRVTGSPPTHFIRRWPATYAGFPSPVGSSQRGDFNSAFGSLDVNDTGVVAFGGLINGSLDTALFAGSSTTTPPARIATYPGVVGLFPQVAQDGTIVIRDNQQRIVTWRNGASTVIADPSLGFTLVGQRPGISSDGTLVSFGGVRNGMPKGIYVSVPHGSGRAVLRIAGEGTGPVTGVSDSERVGITMSGQMATVTFAGLTAAGSGIHAVDFTIVEQNGTATAMVMAPILVAAIGATIGGRLITTLNLYDQPNNCGSVAFRASFGGTAAAAILARRTLPAPMFTARVNFVRVLGPAGTSSTAWSPANVAQLASDVDTLARRLFNVAIQSDGTARDVSDPHAPLSWFNVPNHNAAPLMEAFAEGNPCDTGWRTDAINVYLVNSIVGIGGRCAFALGSVANDNDMMILQPNVLGGPAVAFVHELGHYFNLRHTHANHEVAGGGCAGFAAGDCIDDVPPDVLPNSNDSCAQRDVALAATYAPTSLEYSTLVRNIMSYRCCSLTDATATCGQRLRVLKTARQFRSHVLEQYPTPVINSVTPAFARYPGVSTLALTGTDLPTSGDLHVRLRRQGSLVASPIANGINAVFAGPLPPGNHCSCVYRDGQLVAFREGAPSIRPYAHFGFVSTLRSQLVFRSLDPMGLMVLAFGSSLSQGVPFGGWSYELWVNPHLATYTVSTDANGFFSFQIPIDAGLSGTTIATQALDLSTATPTFTNDAIVRFP